MPSVTIDIMQGNSGMKHVIQGTSVNIVANVSGITPGTTLAMTNDAIAAVKAVTGDVGAPLTVGSGTNSTTMFIESFKPEVISATGEAKVTICAKGFPVAQIELSSTLASTDTNMDNTDTPIDLSYTPQPTSSYFQTWVKGNPGWNSTMGAMHSGATVPWQKGEYSLNMKFTQTAVGTQSALSILTSFAASYMGKVNSSMWSLTLGAARTWQLEGLRATSRDAGRTFEVTVSMHYRPETYDRLVAFNDPATGLPPTDIVAGTGSKYVHVQDEVDFNTLPFTSALAGLFT